jgi:molybdenum cofactor cytidylyltransferase
VIAGIILAAGASSRMGSPKALLEYRGETFIERLVRIFSRVCDPVIVVLGHHIDRIAPVIEGKAQVVVNPSPERGQLSSLQTGLAALPKNADGFLFLPVDCPAVDEATVEHVVQAFEQRQPDTLIVVPQFTGKHGHPVCAVRSLADEFLALPADAQARDVVHSHVSHTLYMDVDDPGILRDVDDPESYRQMVKSLG